LRAVKKTHDERILCSKTSMLIYATVQHKNNISAASTKFYIPMRT